MTTPKKTPSMIDSLCQEAIDLHVKLTAMDKELTEMKQRIVRYATRNTTAQEDTKTGGRVWAHGDDLGRTVRVSFPILSYQPLKKKDDIAHAREIAGSKFDVLFTEAKTYVPVDRFDLRVHEEIGGQDAINLLSELGKENAPRVNFDLGREQA